MDVFFNLEYFFIIIYVLYCLFEIMKKLKYWNDFRFNCFYMKNKNLYDWYNFYSMVDIFFVKSV